MLYNIGILILQPIIFANTSPQSTLEMPPKRDPKLDKVAQIFTDAPNTLTTTIQMVTRAKGFTEKDVIDQALHQRVCHQANKFKKTSYYIFFIFFQPF